MIANLLLGVLVTVAPTRDDATGPFLAAVDAVRRQGGGTIEFAPGEYHFREASATPLQFYISNHTQSDEHPVQLPLVGLTNVVLRGSETRFVLHGATMGFALIDSANIRISGITLDWNRPFLTEATVLGYERGGTLIAINKTRYPYRIRGGRFYARGDGWESTSHYLLAFRGTTHALVEGTVDINWKGEMVETGANGPLLIKRDLSKLGVARGDLLALRPLERPYPAVFVYRTKDTILEDVVLHTAWGMGVICQRSENFTWRGTKDAAARTAGVFAPVGSGRFLTLHADATHFSNCKGLVKVENCLFEGMMDDAINVHSTCLAIKEKTAPDTLRCRYMHSEAYGFGVFQAGEQLRFIRGKTLENGAVMTIKRVTVHDPYEVSVTLEGVVPAEYGAGDAVENADYQPAVDFLGNVVARNRARGALFTTPRPVRVIGNLFERVSGSAILFAGDAQGWYESGACENVVVRGNTFRDCLTSRFQFCDGIISFYPMVKDLDAQVRRYHRNAIIEDNIFETFDVPLLFAISTEKVRFRNNVIRRNEHFPSWKKPPFVFSHCAEMEGCEK